MTVFRNSYLIMRHGQSEANVAGVVVSDPAIGCERFGLTKQGSEQVITSALEHEGEGITQVICSDFLRTQQTAKLVVDTLNLPSAQPEKGLRERFFGRWEGKSDKHYQDIWDLDQLNGQPVGNGVESVESVLQRGFKVLERLERQYTNQVILLVSHGDMLQILRTAFIGKLPKLHRSLSHHETAEIKQLVSQGDECPVLD
ncbi:MAG: histidine phosphatase family protein [Sneathiella sp.]